MPWWTGLLALALSPSAQARGFTATLSGYQEVPPISTPASGDFELASEAPFDYTLTYDGLTSEILAAHIHFGQPGVNGGVIIFLCNNYAVNPTPPGLPPNCTGTSGEVQGTLVAADVIGSDRARAGPQQHRGHDGSAGVVRIDDPIRPTLTEPPAGVERYRAQDSDCDRLVPALPGSLPFRPGQRVKVIVLEDDDIEQRVRRWRELFQRTQALPQARTLTEDEIAAEIDAYREGR